MQGHIPKRKTADTSRPVSCGAKYAAIRYRINAFAVLASTWTECSHADHPDACTWTQRRDSKRIPQPGATQLVEVREV